MLRERMPRWDRLGRAAEAARPSSATFEATDVSVRFEGLTAVNNVRCALRRDEIVGLIGPNGAGKTTLVNVMTGFQRPDSGALKLGERAVTQLKPEQLARLGVIRTFQGARLFGDLTVGENAEVSGIGVRRPRRDAVRLADDALDTVGLAALRDRRAADITTGQERLLQIARAIASQPDFLFLDEPVAGLNEAETDETASAIARLPGKLGCGVLIIEHDMRVIMGLCQRIVVLDQGEVIKVGTPHEVQNDEAVRRAYLGS